MIRRAEVGIEFMVVTDGPGSGAAAYQVPMTYGAHALPGADGNLIGTAEHPGLAPGRHGGRALQPCLWAPWRLPDGTPARGVLASAQYRQHPAAPA